MLDTVEIDMANCFESFQFDVLSVFANTETIDQPECAMLSIGFRVLYKLLQVIELF